MLHRCARPDAVIGFSCCKGLSNRVQTRYECAVLAENIEHLGTDAGHNVHIAHDVFGVGDFNTDFCNIGTDRTHGVGDYIERAALHASFIQVSHRLFQFNRVSPVVGWACILFFL